MKALMQKCLPRCTAGLCFPDSLLMSTEQLFFKSDKPGKWTRQSWSRLISTSLLSMKNSELCVPSDHAFSQEDIYVQVTKKFEGTN